VVGDVDFGVSSSCFASGFGLLFVISISNLVSKILQLLSCVIIISATMQFWLHFSPSSKSSIRSITGGNSSLGSSESLLPAQVKVDTTHSI